MRDGVVIGVALVVAGEGSEVVGALGEEDSEGGDAGEGNLCLSHDCLLLVSSAGRFVRRIPSY